MTLGEMLISAWQHALVERNEEARLGGVTIPVTVFRANNLRSLEFAHGELHILV